MRETGTGQQVAQLHDRLMMMMMMMMMMLVIFVLFGIGLHFQLLFTYVSLKYLLGFVLSSFSTCFFFSYTQLN